MLTAHKASNELITSLKSDLAAQRQLAKEGQKSQQQFEASQAKADKLQAQITEITTTLSEAKTEIKSLTTKLNAARAAEATATATAQAASVRVPGSAMKPSAMGGRGVDQAQVQAQVQATHTAKMKENLYSDLTGLVVTGIKRDGPEDVYDCIQTGRNGSKCSLCGRITMTLLAADCCPCSTTLQAGHCERELGREHGRGRVHVQAAAGRTPRQPAHRDAPRVSRRGDLFPQGPRGEVLLSRAEVSDRETRVSVHGCPSCLVASMPGYVCTCLLRNWCCVVGVLLICIGTKHQWRIVCLGQLLLSLSVVAWHGVGHSVYVLVFNIC